MNLFLFFLLAIFLPPAAVYLKKGLDKNFALNVVLTLAFFFPGLIHAFYIVMTEHKY